MRADWMEDAVCAGVDPELFFGPYHAQAKQICRRCPVQQECLEYALTDSNHVFGTWGGLTELERRALRERAGRSTFVALSLRVFGDDSRHVQIRGGVL